jgi:hypothetical protein
MSTTKIIQNLFYNGIKWKYILGVNMHDFVSIKPEKSEGSNEGRERGTKTTVQLYIML